MYYHYLLGWGEEGGGYLLQWGRGRKLCKIEQSVLFILRSFQIKITSIIGIRINQRGNTQYYNFQKGRLIQINILGRGESFRVGAGGLGEEESLKKRTGLQL